MANLDENDALKIAGGVITLLCGIIAWLWANTYESNQTTESKQWEAIARCQDHTSQLEAGIARQNAEHTAYIKRNEEKIIELREWVRELERRRR